MCRVIPCVSLAHKNKRADNSHITFLKPKVAEIIEATKDKEIESSDT